jgi:hypothetical protein
VAIRFYLDADLLGVAKILADVRPDVTYPGDPGGRGLDGFQRPPCNIQPGDKDVDWIPHVAGAGWIIISRDRHIQHRPAERAASWTPAQECSVATPVAASTSGSSSRSS